MENLWCLMVLGCIFRAPRARVVYDEPPALRSLVVHVSSNNMRFARAFGRKNLHGFQHMVNRTGQGLHPTNMFRLHMDSPPVREHRLECGANRTHADQSGTTGVDTRDVIFVRPTRHQLVDVAKLHRFVESGFNFIRRSANSGVHFCWVFRHIRILAYLSWS